jgi:hypothetical protein
LPPVPVAPPLLAVMAPDPPRPPDADEPPASELPAAPAFPAAPPVSPIEALMCPAAEPQARLARPVEQMTTKP